MQTDSDRLGRNSGNLGLSGAEEMSPSFHHDVLFRIERYSRRLKAERGFCQMIDVLSVDNMRKSDAHTIASGVPGRKLMARAGHAIFEAADWKPPVAVLCGSGNNAGDGYVVAELLRNHGIPADLILLSDRFSSDGKYYYDRCRAAGIPALPWHTGLDLSAYGSILDCLFGTGFHGEPQGPSREAIEAVNRSSAYVVSADINSGLNGDSGLGDPCVRSDLTVSIGGFKPGHFLNRAKDVMARKISVDIGISPLDPPFHLLEEADVRGFFPPRPHFSHKGTYGYLTLIGGSRKYTGAIRLAAMAGAAMRSGAGVVRAAFPSSLYHEIVPALLESTAFPLPDREGELVFSQADLASLAEKSRSIAFGMGIGLGNGARDSLSWLLDHFTGNLIVDADGLTLLAAMKPERLRQSPASLILTPHIGEFSRLTGLSPDQILSDPVKAARGFAGDHGVVLLLKGPATIVTDGSEVLLTDTGCPGMATGGSGDVLSGILAALASWMPNPLRAASAASWINGKAGEKAESRSNAYSMTAGDTARAVGEVLTALLRF